MTSALEPPSGSAHPEQSGRDASGLAAEGQWQAMPYSSALVLARVETKVLWFLIYFVFTEGFGFRTSGWGGLGTSSLGWFGAMQLLVAGVSVVAIVPGFSHLIRWRCTKVGTLVVAVSLIPLYLGVTTVLRMAAGSGAAISDIVAALIQLKFFLLIFLFAVLLSKPNGLQESTAMMAVYALISAVGIIVIAVFRIQTDVAIVSMSFDVTRAFRVIYPGALLVATGWILFFSQYLVSGKVTDLGASLVCLAATVMQLHRGTLIAVVATIALFLFWIVGSSRVVTAKQTWKALSFFVVLGAGTVYFVLHSGMAQAYLQASGSEVVGVSADFLHRLLLVWNSWSYVVSHTFGLGIGFKWAHVEDQWTYLNTAFVAGPTLDSTYANIVILLGIPGIALFVFLYACLAGMSKILRAARNDPFARMFGLFIGAFAAFSSLLGLTTDFALVANSAAVFMLILVMASRMQYLQLERILA